VIDQSMMSSSQDDCKLPSDDASKVAHNLAQILQSDTYRVAQEDIDLLKTSSMRGVRMLLEISKTELGLEAAGITSTIIVFGGARLVQRTTAQTKLNQIKKELELEPGSTKLQRQLDRAESLLKLSYFYDAAREFAYLASRHGQTDNNFANKCSSHVIVTGGGPGIMEAANRGAFDAGCRSIGLNIDLPHEQYPNPYITPDLCFKFNYFALRKFHFVMRAVGAVLFPGGYGTLDELFEVLTLRQVGINKAMPIILFGRDYWSRLINFDFMAESGLIDDEDRKLIQFADSADEAWNLIQESS
tara:strand:- start:3022 stop:3924 length:903 start_codon:yes stop_codon:yes gene_type:complete